MKNKALAFLTMGAALTAGNAPLPFTLAPSVTYRQRQAGYHKARSRPFAKRIRYIDILHYRFDVPFRECKDQTPPFCHMTVSYDLKEMDDFEKKLAAYP